MSIQEVKLKEQSDKKREGRQWARQELVQSVNRAIKEVNYINNIYGLFNNIDEITNYTRAEALLEDIVDNLNLVKDLFKADTKKDSDIKEKSAELPPKMAEVVQALSENCLR